MDKVEAQYALESTSQPLGISSYELSKLIPEEFRGSMPTIEEIEAELNGNRQVRNWGLRYILAFSHFSLIFIRSL